MVTLVETHQIKKGHQFWQEIDGLCFASKNLYNKSLYKIKEFHKENNTYVTGNDFCVYTNTNLYHSNKEEPEFRNGIATKALKQVYIQINKIFTSYRSALCDYHKNPNKYKGIPKEPSYKEKRSGRNVLTFPKDALRFKKDGTIQLSKTNIFIQSKIEKRKILQVRLVPCVSHYNIEVIYEKDIKNSKLDQTRYYAIDLGVNNLATLSSNDSVISPILINGRIVKSINQYYNKKLSKLKSLLPDGQKTSNKINRLTRKRNNKISNYLHNASRYIVDNAVSNNIGTIIIGKNINWKQNINIGKVNNQKFASIPFSKFINLIQYKAELLGINVLLHEESYTSKCSFLDFEEIKKHDEYLGKRTKRGLFVSNKGICINADLNGSLNIMRKVVGRDVFTSDSIEDYAVNPIHVNV